MNKAYSIDGVITSREIVQSAGTAGLVSYAGYLKTSDTVVFTYRSVQS